MSLFTKEQKVWIVMFIFSTVFVVVLVAFLANHLGRTLRSYEENLNASKTATVALRGALQVRGDTEVTLLKIMVLRATVDLPTAKKIASSVVKYSQKRELDPDLVICLIDVESGFNPIAESNVGAKGLMQLMPHWVKILGIEKDLFDIDTNIQHGTQVFAMYLDMYKDLETAIAVYNRGPGQIDWDIIKNKDPKSGFYVDEVMKRYKKLKELEEK